MLTSTKFLEEFNQHFLIKPSQKKRTLAGFVAQHFLCVAICRWLPAVFTLTWYKHTELNNIFHWFMIRLSGQGYLCTRAPSGRGVLGEMVGWTRLVIANWGHEKIAMKPQHKVLVVKVLHVLAQRRIRLWRWLAAAMGKVKPTCSNAWGDCTCRQLESLLLKKWMWSSNREAPDMKSSVTTQLSCYKRKGLPTKRQQVWKRKSSDTILIECCINAANCFCVRLVVDGFQMLMSDVGSQACSGMCGWGIDVHHHLTFEVDKFV